MTFDVWLISQIIIVLIMLVAAVRLCRYVSGSRVPSRSRAWPLPEPTAVRPDRFPARVHIDGLQPGMSIHITMHNVGTTQNPPKPDTRPALDMPKVWDALNEPRLAELERGLHVIAEKTFGMCPRHRVRADDGTWIATPTLDCPMCIG